MSYCCSLWIASKCLYANFCVFFTILSLFAVSCWNVNGFKLCILCSSVRSKIYFISGESNSIVMLILRHNVMLINIHLLNVFVVFMMIYALWIYSIFVHKRHFLYVEYFKLVYAVYWLSIFQNVERLIISQLYCFCSVFSFV